MRTLGMGEVRKASICVVSGTGSMVGMGSVCGRCGVVVLGPSQRLRKEMFALHKRASTVETVNGEGKSDAMGSR